MTGIIIFYGKLHGKWLKWHDNGQLLSEENYKNGELIDWENKIWYNKKERGK